MKQIEGIDLNNIIEQASAELLAEKEKGLVSLYKSKLNELNQAVSRKMDAQTQVDKEAKNIQRLQGWLKQFKEGNWEVINLSEAREEK